MDPKLYTDKAFESLAKLPQYADKYSNQRIEAVHLVKALLDAGPSGIAQRIVVKSGVDSAAFDKKLEEYLQRQPKVSDVTNKVMGPTLMESLKRSNELRKDYGDSFISIEHLLLGATLTDSNTRRLLQEVGGTADGLTKATKEIRGNNKVTSKNAEETYEALSKYARDLTAAAREGKLDPVIGRDEEIRRAIQILSRRTKNNPILLGEPGGKVFLHFLSYCCLRFLPFDLLQSERLQSRKVLPKESSLAMYPRP